MLIERLPEFGMCVVCVFLQWIACESVGAKHGSTMLIPQYGLNRRGDPSGHAQAGSRPDLQDDGVKWKDGWSS